MEEVPLAHASTFMRGHRPKEKMPALLGEFEKFHQFSTQRPFQTLAGSLAMRKTEFPIRMFPVFSMPLAIVSVSATQSSRNLLVRNSSPRQKVQGDQGDPISLDQPMIFKESDGGNETQFKRTYPLNQVTMETLVETFTTQAMWLIVQAMLSLSVGYTLRMPNLMKMSTTHNLSVGNTAGAINKNWVEQKKQKTRSEEMEQGFADLQMATLVFLFLVDLRMKFGTFLAMITNEEVVRVTERTRKMMIMSEQMEQVKADFCQSSMSTCQQAVQVFLSGEHSDQSGIDIDCTMSEIARENGTTLNDLNAGCVVEVAV